MIQKAGDRITVLLTSALTKGIQQVWELNSSHMGCLLLYLGYDYD